MASASENWIRTTQVKEKGEKKIYIYIFNISISAPLSLSLWFALYYFSLLCSA